MSTSDHTDPPPKRLSLLHGAGDPRAPGATPLWTASIGVGVNVVLSQLYEIDTLSQRIAALPERSVPARAVVSDYLDTIRTLAGNWLAASRPLLLQGLRGLHGFAIQLSAHDGARLRALAGEPGMAQLAGLGERLDGVAATLEQLNGAIGACLEHLALASGELETDTVLVTHRLQADQVHAAMLSQQLSSLQQQLGHTGSRQHGGLNLGFQSEQRRRERASGHDALDSTRRQLDQIRACQAETLREAAFLQQLLPTLSSYLAGIDRMGAGIDAVLLGIRTLQARLRELAAKLRACDGAITPQQLDAALPHWRHLAARLDCAAG